MSGRSSALSGRRSAAAVSSYPLPPTPDSSKKLTESLGTLSLGNAQHSSSSSSSSSPLTGPTAATAPPPPVAPSSRPRRPSMDLRHGRSPTPSSSGSDINPRRLTRAPSTPNIRKRSSIASLCSSPVPGSGPHVSGRTSLSRRSSMLSLRSTGTPEPTQQHMPFPFRRESLPVQDLTAPTTVVFHDTSYKHRYARPNTGKADLATIVERPERIAAATLGVTAAQTRIGKSKLSIRKSIRVGGLLDPEVMLVHSHGSAKGGKSWPEELAAMCGLATEKLKRGECEVPKNLHQGDLYLCGESREDMEGCLGAIYDGVDIVFGGANETQGHEMDEEDQSGVTRAFVCIRPPGHHCAEAQPSGFCWLNNVHIAIAHAARQHGLTHAVILDFDLHHGDGSQSIAWTLNELASSPNTSLKKTAGIHVPQIGYFSLHDINSYPCEYGDTEKVKNASLNLEAHGQFIQNMHLKPYHTADDFWELYETRYSGIIAKAREFLSAASVSKPKKNGREFKAGLFLSAGFDASEHESAGMQRHQVNVPTGFFARFTSDAVALAEQYCGGRVLSVLEGGYSDRALMTGVFAHLAGLACPSPTTVSGYVPPSTGLLPVPEPYPTRPTSADRGWDPEWWGIENMSELERYHDKMTAKKPTVDKPSTSYLSATAASSARAEIPRRVMSTNNLSTGPPPVVVIPWEVQAWELSRRIIPEYEESAEIPPLDKLPPKSKRHSATGVPDQPRMTLRDRKPKVPDPAPTLDVRRRRTTTGAMSTTSSRAPSRAQTPAIRGHTPMPQSRGPTPAPGATDGSRRISSSSGGVSVAGPRTLAKKPSVIGNGINSQRTPPQSLQRKPPTVLNGKSKSATSRSVSPKSTISPSTTSSSRSSSNGSSTTPPVTLPPSSKELDDAFMNKFQKVRITYKNREREEELHRMERQKEELERKLAVEKRRLAASGTNGAGQRRTSRVGTSRSPSSARRASVSSAVVNGGGVQAVVNGHAEKETKMVTTPPPMAAGAEGGAGADHTFRGGEIKFAPADPKAGPNGVAGRG